jgi:hypothetical protein
MGQGPAENIHQMVRICSPARCGDLSLCYTADHTLCRLNSKLKTRNVEISDLITDLSDGVRAPLGPEGGLRSHNQVY